MKNDFTRMMAEPTPFMFSDVFGCSLPKDSELWFYGNGHLLDDPQKLWFSPSLFDQTANEDHLLYDRIEVETETAVLAGRIVVSGFHNARYQRSALVPLRWGAPRVLIAGEGFFHALGPDLKEEPFRAARLWRYTWDPNTDLIISRRAPSGSRNKSLQQPAVDRLVKLFGAEGVEL